MTIKENITEDLLLSYKKMIKNKIVKKWKRLFLKKTQITNKIQLMLHKLKSISQPK